MEIEVARHEFSVKTELKRLWELLPFAIFNGLEGIEKVSVVSEKFFHAEMPIKFAFVQINARLSGEIYDIIEYQKITVALTAKVIKGILTAYQIITFNISKGQNDEIKVSCEIVAKGSGPIFKWIVLRKARVTSIATINNIEKTIKRLA